MCEPKEESNIINALFREGLGTFAIVFVGGAAGIAAVKANWTEGQRRLVAMLTFSIIFMIVIYVCLMILPKEPFGYCNPAVTFALHLHHRLGYKVGDPSTYVRLISYIISQVVGGILAVAALYWIFGTANGSQTLPYDTSATSSTLNPLSEPLVNVVLIEALLTFFLVLTILSLNRNLTAKMTPIKAIFIGFFAGLVLAVSIGIAFGVSGGSFNPARSTGPAIFTNSANFLLIYWVGPLLGALAAAFIISIIYRPRYWWGPSAPIAPGDRTLPPHERRVDHMNRKRETVARSTTAAIDEMADEVI